MYIFLSPYFSILLFVQAWGKFLCFPPSPHPEKVCNNAESRSCSWTIPFKASVFSQNLKALKRLGWKPCENRRSREIFKKKNEFLWSSNISYYVSHSLSTFDLGGGNFERDIYLDLGLPVTSRDQVRHRSSNTSRPEGTLWRLGLHGNWGRRTTKE